LNRHYKIGPSTDHRAKFYAGRLTHLGDLARLNVTYSSCKTVHSVSNVMTADCVREISCRDCTKFILIFVVNRKHKRKICRYVWHLSKPRNRNDKLCTSFTL